MLDQNALLTILRKHKPQLQQEFPIHRLALFGSWARNEQHEDEEQTQ